MRERRRKRRGLREPDRYQRTPKGPKWQLRTTSGHQVASERRRRMRPSQTEPSHTLDVTTHGWTGWARWAGWMATLGRPIGQPGIIARCRAKPESPGDSPGGGLPSYLGMQATRKSVGTLTRRRTGEQEGNKVLYMTAPGTCAVLRTALKDPDTKGTRDEGSAGFRTSRSAGCAGACAAAPTAIGRRG